MIYNRKKNACFSFDIDLENLAKYPDQHVHLQSLKLQRPMVQKEMQLREKACIDLGAKVTLKVA